MSIRRRWLTAAVAAVTVAGLLTAVRSAEAASALIFGAAADTTYTQVGADGDNSAKTTLATCPALCDGTAAAERDAFAAFTVAGVPAGATVTQATLEVYSWTRTRRGSPPTRRPAARPAPAPGRTGPRWARPWRRGRR